MKNNIFFTPLLIITTLSFSQNENNKLNSARPENLKGLVKNDTKKTKVVTLKDSLVINNQQEKKNSTITIHLKTPEEKTDYFKYIFPIITLLLGIGVNRFIDYKNNRKKINKSGKRWLSELRVLEKPLQKQISNIDDFLEQHDQVKFTFPRPELVTTLDCEVFNSLDKSDLVEYLELFKKNNEQQAVENSNDINAFITILKSHYINFRNQFEEYKKNISSYTTTISRNLQALQKEFVNYGIQLEHELNSDPIDDARYKPILDLFNSEILPYMQDGNYDIYKLEKDFYFPLISVLSHLRLDERTHLMVDYAKSSITEIKGIRLEKTYLAENFKTIKDWYIESKDYLPKVIKLLQ